MPNSVTPWTMACQAPPSMGFSRQEHWTGLPFPSPVIKHEWSERNEVAQSCPTLGNPMDDSLPGSSVHGIFQARVLEWVAISFSILYDGAYNVIREWIFKRINPTNSNENTKSFIHKVAKIIKSNNKECWQGSWPILEKLGKQLWRMKC